VYSFFQSKLCSFLSGKSNDLTKTYYISDGASSQYKRGNIPWTSAFKIMILIWMLGDTSLQCHMVKVYVMGLGEELKG
jgi:hypothetical protein